MKSTKTVLEIDTKVIAKQVRLTQIFESQIQAILHKINSYDKQLTQDEIELISLHSCEALEKSHESVQQLLTKYKMVTPFNIKETPVKPSSKEKNILFVTAIFPGVGHGGGLRMFDIMQELAKKGYNVHLYSPEAPPGERGSIKPLKSFLKSYHVEKVQDFHYLSFQNWLQKNKIHFDSVYYVWPYHAQMMFNQNQYFENQIFEFIEVTTRRVWMDLVSYIKQGELWKIADKILEFWMSYHFERIATERANHLVCVTPKDAEFVEAIFHKKVSKVIPMGISQYAVLDLIEKAQKISEISKSVGFLGNYLHYPNLDGVIWYLDNVHAKVLQSVPDYKFYVIGKGDLKAVKKKYEHFKKSIVWVGEVENIVEWIKKLEICTAPLITGAGIRVKLTQYAAVQKPIVSTTVGACGSPFKDKVDILIADEPNDFANAVISLLKNDQLKNKMSKNSYKIVKQHFYWDGFIKDLETII